MIVLSAARKDKTVSRKGRSICDCFKYHLNWIELRMRNYSFFLRAVIKNINNGSLLGTA